MFIYSDSIISAESLQQHDPNKGPLPSWEDLRSLFRTPVCVFFTLIRKEEQDKANGLVSPFNDAIIWDI